MNIASAVPDKLMDSWNGVVKFINTQIAPAASWSSGIFSSMSGVGSKDDDTTASSPGERYGASEAVGKEIERLQTKYCFAEDTTAGNEEARLCLKKGGLGLWRVCEDFEDFVRSVVVQEQERRQSDTILPKLQVRVYYAESDISKYNHPKEYCHAYGFLLILLFLLISDWKRRSAVLRTLLETGCSR